MKDEIIGSSSKGNCIVVEDKLMLDVGVAYSKIKKYLSNIKLIFISHAHLDHLLPSTIRKIAYNYPIIKFLTGSEVVVQKLIENGVNKKNIYILNPCKLFDLGILKLKLDLLVHDTPNYALHFNINKKRGVYIVDTASVDNIDAKNYDLYLIESNYKEDILQKHIDEVSHEDIGDLVYLNRVPLTHRSYEKANYFLINNMGENSQFEYLHQSEYNFEKEEI